MISQQITDIRHFMQHLLSAETFDRFLLAEARIQMGISWEIDGKIRPAFYDDDNTPSEEFIAWQEVRPTIYSILRGNRLPLSMKIILALPQKTVRHLMVRSGKEEEANRIQGMFINILYRPTGLLLTTGLSRSDFSADKTAEQVFDDSIASFLKNHEIA